METTIKVNNTTAAKMTTTKKMVVSPAERVPIVKPGAGVIVSF